MSGSVFLLMISLESRMIIPNIWGVVVWMFFIRFLLWYFLKYAFAYKISSTLSACFWPLWSLTLMLLLANFTKWCKNPEKWLKPWQMGTHLRALSKSFPMNTNMTGSRRFSKFKYLCIVMLWTIVASAAEGCLMFSGWKVPCIGINWCLLVQFVYLSYHAYLVR